MKITLYHLPNSRSQRIIWLLTELNVDFNLITVPRTVSGEAPESLKQIHPLGKVPIVVIENENHNTVLAETSAIVDYFAVLFPQHSLFTPENMADYVYFKNFAESSIMPNLALKQIFARLVSFSPFFAKPITKAIKKGVDRRYLNDSLSEQLRLVDNQLKMNFLKGQRFLAGNHLTGADILSQFMLLALSVSYSEKAVPNFGDFPNIQAYLQRIESLPSYQNALEKGGFNQQEFIQYWQKAW